MSTTTQRQPIVRALTILLLLAATMLAAIPSQHPAAGPDSPSVQAAAATVSSVHRIPVQPCTIATDGGGEQPPLSYSQALRLVHTVTPGLVDITTTGAGGDGKAGTGIALTSTGLVMTNYHVISGAIALSVHDLGNELDYAARIVGTDPARDIAVLQLHGATALRTVRLGGRVAVGDVVASIGNAHGFGDPSLGAGRVVALRQGITSTTGQARPLTGLIEAVNGVEPGESGGPMVNLRGQVIGVTVATQLDDDGNPNGHGYAIPIATAMASVHRILAQST